MTKEAEINHDLTGLLDKARGVVGQYYKGKDLERFLKPLYRVAEATNSSAAVVLYQNTLSMMCGMRDSEILSCRLYQRIKLLGSDKEEILHLGRQVFTATRNELYEPSKREF